MSISNFAYSQTTLSFGYDAAGNQVVREFICINCNNNRPGQPKIFTEQTKPDLLQSEHQEILYYPNPVEEVLHLEWAINDKQYVNEIQLYSTSGQFIQGLSQLNEQNSADIKFLNLTSGIYHVIVIYNHGEQKSLKILKK